jgi:glutathione S-transferase
MADDVTRELILHHYPSSPFAEKARLMLGFKGLAWRSVQIPAVMPKPELTALTGGLRRTPVLQVGADVYIDTALIAEVLQAHQPQPAWDDQQPLAPALASWLDSSFFWTVMGYCMQPAGIGTHIGSLNDDEQRRFVADRSIFTSGAPRLSGRDASAALALHLARLEAQLLRHGQHWLLGAQATVADFALAHNLWFIHRSGALAQVLAPFAALNAWYARLAAAGHGHPQAFGAGEALLVARLASDAHSHVPTQVQRGLGFEAGQPISVVATDYGPEASAGVLVGLSNDEVVLAHDGEQVGRVHVHLPRIGYRIKKEGRA